jgi:hypothetical protein
LFDIAVETRIALYLRGKYGWWWDNGNAAVATPAPGEADSRIGYGKHETLKVVHLNSIVGSGWEITITGSAAMQQVKGLAIEVMVPALRRRNARK